MKKLTLSVLFMLESGLLIYSFFIPDKFQYGALTCAMIVQFVAGFILAATIEEY